MPALDLFDLYTLDTVPPALSCAGVTLADICGEDAEEMAATRAEMAAHGRALVGGGALALYGVFPAGTPAPARFEPLPMPPRVDLMACLGATSPPARKILAADPPAPRVMSAEQAAAIFAAFENPSPPRDNAAEVAPASAQPDAAERARVSDLAPMPEHFADDAEGVISADEAETTNIGSHEIEIRPRSAESVFVYYLGDGAPVFVGVVLVRGDRAAGFMGQAWRHEGLTVATQGPDCVQIAARGVALAYTG